MVSESVGERVVETTKMLRTRALVVAPSQDAEDLVKRGHFIAPSFMVKRKKMKKKMKIYNHKRCNREFRKKRVKLENLSSVDKVARHKREGFFGRRRSDREQGQGWLPHGGVSLRKLLF